LGQNKGISCNSAIRVKEVTGYAGVGVMYCFKVSNKGTSDLKSLRITNTEIVFDKVVLNLLKPGQTDDLAGKET
jgi:hypothetical protein